MLNIKRVAFYLMSFAIGMLAMIAWRLWPELTRPTHLDPAFQIPSPFELASLPVATRFDFPLGSEHGALTYNAQHFTENHHLGDDLNGIGGENSDLGDPIYAVADGRVARIKLGNNLWESREYQAPGTPTLMRLGTMPLPLLNHLLFLIVT